MNISLTDILITVFLVLIYKLLQKKNNTQSVIQSVIQSGINTNNIDNFTEEKKVIDISKLKVVENNIKMKLTKNNNSIDINKDLIYKIVRPVKNSIIYNNKKYNLKKITFSKSNINNVKLEIQLHFTDNLKIIIPIIESKKNNNYLQLFRIDHFDTYQSGKYLINNLPRKVQGVNNKSIVFNIWFYPLVKFINSNKTLHIDTSGEFINLYTKKYYLNSVDINSINECF